MAQLLVDSKCGSQDEVDATIEAKMELVRYYTRDRFEKWPTVCTQIYKQKVRTKAQWTQNMSEDLLAKLLTRRKKKDGAISDTNAEKLAQRLAKRTGQHINDVRRLYKVIQPSSLPSETTGPFLRNRSPSGGSGERSKYTGYGNEADIKEDSGVQDDGDDFADGPKLHHNSSGIKQEPGLP
jgi:hypothetical protein